MAVVASSVGVAILGEAAVGTIGAGLLGGAVIGAGAGALYSGLTGDGNILNSMLTGGLIGGGIGGLGAAAGPTLMGTAGTTAATTTPALTAVAAPSVAPVAAIPEVASGASAFGGTGGASVSPTAGYVAAPSTVTNSALLPTQMAELDAAGYGGMSNGVLNQVPGTAAFNPAPYVGNQVAGMTGKEMLGYGLAGTAAMSLLGGMNQKKIQTGTTGTQNQAMIRPYTYNVSQNPSAYATGPQYGSNGLPILPTSEKKYFNQSYTAGTPYNAANGGLMSVGGITYDAATQRYSGLPQMSQSPLVDGPQLSSDQVSQLTPQYQAANPNAYSYDAKTQRYGAANPTMQQLSAFQAQLDQAAAAQQPQQYSDGSSNNGGANGGLMQSYAMGGGVDGEYNLGSYSDGGRLLKGPGDGVSDDIPAVIGQKQPARLADGEFVIPARIVSEIGNGSTDAGAKRLYAMMDNIQAGRKKTIGKDNVAKDTKAKKHLLG